MDTIKSWLAKHFAVFRSEPTNGRETIKAIEDHLYELQEMNLEVKRITKKIVNSNIRDREDATRINSR